MVQRQPRHRGAAPSPGSESPLGQELPESWDIGNAERLARLGAGRSLPGEHQQAFERALGTSFGDVRIHTDDRAAELVAELGAEAVALGADLFFADGAFAPGTADGDRRLAHELLHVEQARSGSTSDPAGSESEAYGSEDAVAAAAREARTIPGEPANVAAPRAIAGPVLARGEGEEEGPRQEEAEVSPEEYQASMEELQEFLGEQHQLDDYIPSTGIGAFDVEYLAAQGILNLTCRVTFVWQAAEAATYPDVPEDQLYWTRPEQDEFSAGFLQVSTETWSGRHTFHCRRRWWENLPATTRITFVRDDQDPHHRIQVRKVPADPDLVSAVGNRHARYQEHGIQDPWAPPWQEDGDVFVPGDARFDSNDLEEVTFPEGNRQVTVAHESGHLLGLGDEYAEGEHRAYHEDLVRDEFGHGVPMADDGRIMSSGMEVGPEHGVTFLEALRMVTGMYEDGWGYEQLPLSPGPADRPAGDHPAAGENRAV